VLIENLQVDVYQIVEEILLIKKRDESKVILSNDVKNILKFSTDSSLIVNDNANNGTSIINRLDHSEIIDTKKNNDEPILELVTHADDFDNNYYVNNIIYDSNNSINSSEGVEGYTSLFRSRFDKSLKILSNRPDSKRIKRIAFIKQSLNQSRINLKSQSIENPEESLFIAGLVMEKKIKKK
jgi:DNA polymerase II small subunit